MESGVREVTEGSIFGRFSAKLGPETHLDRRGSSYSAGCIKNQLLSLIDIYLLAMVLGPQMATEQQRPSYKAPSRIEALAPARSRKGAETLVEGIRGRECVEIRELG